MKYLNKLLASVSIVLSAIILYEIVVNLLAINYLYPIKNSNSYGYLSKKTAATIIPLNKYHTRYLSQIMLPVDIISYKLTNKEIYPAYNKELNKYGYKTKNGKIIIKEKFTGANYFNNNYAIVSIELNNEEKFGTIDKKGNWVIKPEYSHICSLSKFYTRACLDNDHCGVINIFGDKITTMNYHSNKITAENKDFQKYFCEIHINSKQNNNCF